MKQFINNDDCEIGFTVVPILVLEANVFMVDNYWLRFDV